jgi:SAM-dependent methyltransferase
VAKPAVAVALSRLRAGRPLRAADLEVVASALDEPLFRRLCTDDLVASEEVELLIGALRAEWLRAALSEPAPRWPSQPLLAAIALQMQTTEWIYTEHADEARQVDALAARLRSDPEASSIQAVLVYAMYRSLEGLGIDEHRLAQVEGPDDATVEVLRRHFVEPSRLRELRGEVPRMTDVTDPVSRAVAAHYEEAPYPRWRRVASVRPRPLGEVVAGAVGDPGLAARIVVDRPSILVAGCGTGRHAVLAAARYAGSRVLAVDLSLTSLSYAIARTRELGLPNIEFGRADLLRVGDLGRTFDAVECIGVLHHLDDPESGWAALRRVVRPGGLMKIGLYSRLGRSFLDPVSRIVAERGLGPTAEGIAAVRGFVRGLPAEQPVRRLTGVPDFYSRGGCRDLFFHEHEVRFDLRHIGRMIDALDLEFLGFESPRLRVFYRKAFPDEPSGRSLRNWDALERAYPSMFSAMYRFWVRVPDR